MPEYERAPVVADEQRLVGTDVVEGLDAVAAKDVTVTESGSDYAIAGDLEGDGVVFDGAITVDGSGNIIVGGDTGSFTGFMMQRGRMVILGDAGKNLGDSMYDGTIYVGTDPYGAAGNPPVAVETVFFAINPDGSRKWSFDMEDGAESSPAIGPDGTIYVGSYDGKLYAIRDEGDAERALDSGIVAARYVDGHGQVATRYPANPNGSVDGISTAVTW